MKIKLLIASDDTDYCDHISNYFLDNYSDTINVNVRTSLEALPINLAEKKYDAALVEACLFDSYDFSGVTMPMILSDERFETIDNAVSIKKYQRISSIYSTILQEYAKVSKSTVGHGVNKANISAIWSPTGGVGKTSVALALASSAALKGKKTIYLNLELFSSTSAFFETSGKSISVLFEMLESKEGNVESLIQSLLHRDPVNNILYFCCPNNNDDMNILSSDNVSSLITVCSGFCDELIIDMSCLCDERSLRTFELADNIFLVTDRTSVSAVKLERFINHNNVYSRFAEKMIFIANKGAVPDKKYGAEMISLPLVQSDDITDVYKVLANSFSVITQNLPSA